jgi:predicted O-methyltransferase YrrM
MHLDLNQYYQLREDVAHGLRQDLKESFDNTEGMIGLDEAIFLYHLARQVMRGCIVEVGSYRGRSTVFLARGSIDGKMAPVYAIDPQRDFVGVLGGVFGPKDRELFYKAMLDHKCSEIVRLVNLSSEMISGAWTDKIALLWIDGDHSYSGVKRDFECWRPHLLPEAIVVFDDATDPTLGPRLFIDELTALEEFREISQVGRVSVVRCRDFS